MALAKLIGIVIMAYLIGSIPFGVLLGRFLGGVDPRDHGSGKTGGTNVMRTLGTKVGILVIALDIAKAAWAVVLAGIIFGTTVVAWGDFYIHRQIAALMAAFFVIVGHNWPVFFKFRGGRGVAAFFGALLPIAPAAAIFGAEVLLIVAVSLSLFAFSTMLGWAYYGEKSLEYLLGVKAVTPYRLVFVTVIFLGSLGTIDFVWLLSDILNGLMALPNLIGLILLAGVIVTDTVSYFQRVGRLDDVGLARAEQIGDGS